MDSVTSTDRTFVDPELVARLTDAPLDSLDSLARVLDHPWNDGLAAAIARWTDFAQDARPDYDFFRDTIPKLRAWALDLHPHRPIDMLRAGEAGEITLSQRHVRHLLACAFFLGTLDSTKAGSLSLTSLYRSQSPPSVERLVCLFAYFHIADEVSDEPSIRVARRRLDAERAPRWESLDTPLSSVRVTLHTGRMEDPDSEVFFDFANRDLHIHSIIPSLTQEEVLFSTCPELFPALLVCERMDDDEVIVLDGARRICEYRGYLRTFRFTGLRADRKVQEVLAADAVYYDHFAPESVARDLNKVWLGFTSCRGRSVSTGHWGCGVFGGNRVAKFVQQCCAAAVAGVSLDYSTFGDEDTAKALGELLATLSSSGATVGAAVRAVSQYDGPNDDDSVARHIVECVRRV